MDQIDVATLTTAVLILFFFLQVGQHCGHLGTNKGRRKSPVDCDPGHQRTVLIVAMSMR